MSRLYDITMLRAHPPVSKGCTGPSTSSTGKQQTDTGLDRPIIQDMKYKLRSTNTTAYVLVLLCAVVGQLPAQQSMIKVIALCMWWCPEKNHTHTKHKTTKKGQVEFHFDFFSSLVPNKLREVHRQQAAGRPALQVPSTRHHGCMQVT